MIDVDRLTKRYGRFLALDHICFHADAGEIVGFLGPNGAGKTTTMRVLTGYMPPTAGTARIAGFDVLIDSLEVRQRVGYLPETVRLYRDMSVRGYLKFMGQLRGVDRLDQRISEVLEVVGLRERARHLISSLSRGMQQRVALAQAIVHDPPVLILDEPTIGLDPHQVQELRALIRELGRTRTVLLSTHILSEAEQVCDRVIIMDRGRIVAEDTPANLRDRLARTSRLFVRVGASAAEVAALLASIPGVTNVDATADGFLLMATPQATDVRPAIASAIVGQSWPLLELRPWATTLEEIFLELTTRLDAPAGDGEGAGHA
jgi:ABC-2 type transport system ATP-binding protein